MFGCGGAEPLRILGVTGPSWRGNAEVEAADGPWEPTRCRVGSAAMT